ncbi:MAG: site-specific integrase [Proteobacteria bacterium]|nr:site-specific integrase [Pseudomonadota bacterium]
MKVKTDCPAEAPILVKRGSVTVKIYTESNSVNGATYQQFTVVYYDGTQRKRKKFGKLADAKREADLVATKLSRGEHQVLQLTSTDRMIYLEAMERLRPFQRPLNLAVREYTSAIEQLPDGITLKEAVDFFRRRNSSSAQKRTVRQVADEMLAAKRTAKLSEVHLKDLECRLNRFADAFQMNIAGVSSSMIQAWLDAMKGSGRTKVNYLRVVSSLFRFAVKRKYLPKDAIEEIEAVEQVKEGGGEIEIFAPEEMQEILNAASPEMLPWLAIAAFAGLRTAEIHRLDWSGVNLLQKHIEIKAAKAKTAARRLAPLTDNLAVWLGPYAQPVGKVTSYTSWWNQFGKLSDEVNRLRKERGDLREFAWKHNALRHSFISYRVADTQNVAQVALEAGNSPQMVFSNYRQLVTPEAARAWFAIVPAGSSKIVPMRAAYVAA